MLLLRCLQLIVPMYATPPKYGAAIAATILADPQLRQQWQVGLCHASPAGCLAVCYSRLPVQCVVRPTRWLPSCPPQEELAELPRSILRRRQQLYDALREAGVPGSWEHIVQQVRRGGLLGLVWRQRSCGKH